MQTDLTCERYEIIVCIINFYGDSWPFRKAPTYGSLVKESQVRAEESLPSTNPA